MAARASPNILLASTLTSCIAASCLTTRPAADAPDSPPPPSAATGEARQSDRPTEFRVKFPGEPKVSRAVENLAIGEVPTATWSAQTREGVVFSVSTADFPEAFVAARDPREFIDVYGRDLNRARFSATVKSEERIVHESYPGKAYVLTSALGEVKARTFLVGARLYTLNVFYNPSTGAPDAGGFLESLQLIDPPPRLARRRPPATPASARKVEEDQEALRKLGMRTIDVYREGFSVTMPGEPTVQQQKVTIPRGTAYLSSWMVPVGENTVFSVSMAEYPKDIVADRPPAELLYDACDAVANQLDGTIQSEELITLSGYPGLEYAVSRGANMVKARSFVVGPRLYTLLVRHPVPWGGLGAETFLRSLTLHDPPPPIVPEPAMSPASYLNTLEDDWEVLPPSEWRELVPREGFSVMMPSAPRVHRFKFEGERGEIAVAMWTVQTPDGTIYGVNTTDYPDALIAARSPTAILEDEVGHLPPIEADLDTSGDRRAVELQGYPGLAYEHNAPDIQARHFLVGPRVYTLFIAYNSMHVDPAAEKFFGSLKFVDPPAPIPYVERK